MNWTEHKKESQERRKRNLAESTELLKQSGVSFSPHNNGVHLVIDGSWRGMVDFWPSTGKWTIRETGRTDRGVHKLLEYLGRGQ